MKDGYILLYRQITENHFWSEKPYSRGQAWVDLLLKANFKDVKLKIRGKTIELKRGQLLRSVQNLATDWGWSENKVRRFLHELTAEHMAEVVGRAYGTLITIENYERYQDVRRANGRADERADGRADGRQEKESKRKYKESKERGFFEAPTLADVSSYVKELGYQMDPAAYFDYYSETNWRKKNGQPIRDWKASVRTWERREKEFANKSKDSPKKPAQVEPPKYKQLEPDPEVETVQMPADMRKKLKKIEILEGAL